MPLAHDVLDVMIATAAVIVAVSVFFPVYLVVVLAKTLVRRGQAIDSLTSSVPIHQSSTARGQ